MRIREIQFSTALRDIDLARWCMNNLSFFGDDRFYLRWNPDTHDYAMPLYRAQDLRRVRAHEGLRIVRLASRILAGPAVSEPRPEPAQSQAMPVIAPPSLPPAVPL